jgi:Ca2+-binding EF-hand superfamily protein
MNLSIDTAKSLHKTSLSEQELNSMKNRLQNFDYDVDMSDQYTEIQSILNDLPSHVFLNEFDKAEVNTLRAVLTEVKKGKRGSKPSEFVSILSKILENLSTT